MDSDEKSNTERIKLDETLKLLFSVSKPLVINIVNYFFDESFDVNQKYDVEFMATESADLNMEMRRADFMVKIGRKQKFHFEFQLNREKFMVLRMFDYGYREAVKDTGAKDIPTIYFPKQTVLYLEKGRDVPDELKLKVVYPITDMGKQEIMYKVFVKKVWEISKEEKMKHGLYSLLPLEIFKLRERIEKIKTADEKQFLRLSERIKTDIIEIVRLTDELMSKDEITEEDYTKITEATIYLLNYFSENYADLKLSKEVSEMTEYIYTRGKAEGVREGKAEGVKEGRAEGKLETAIEMLKKGLEIELISEVTKLPEEEIKKLLEKINNQNN
ncbi:hypothetical protein [Sedimentibacter sp.]|uniref:hypothetical protein n=1 Tax=Sedimentibacter sp. TaxID=1960295 RepID=UPI00289B2541|nr:hypothetical protein [Sedimentibacter sp.]